MTSTEFVAPHRATPESRNGRVSFGVLHKLATPGKGLEADLRLAVEDPAAAFVMHYQPVVDLTTGKVVGVESLVRWQHPILGLLGPNRFISLAEDCGLIRELGDWALGQAIRDAAVLTQLGRDLDMGINFSVHQLDDDVVTKVRHALETHQVGPGRLTVEVTESAFVKGEGITAERYEALSHLGVKFAIDDFGTSFSSLLHLRLYPISALKIDGVVVAGIGTSANDEATCDSIISLARAVSASTVAEGVETTEQYAVLRSMGCQRGQGWLWSPAVPIDEIEDAIAACEKVPVAERQSRMPRVRTLERHPSGVRWTVQSEVRQA